MFEHQIYTKYLSWQNNLPVYCSQRYYGYKIFLNKLRQALKMDLRNFWLYKKSILIQNQYCQKLKEELFLRKALIAGIGISIFRSCASS
jgi:hypothetical protein